MKCLGSSIHVIEAIGASDIVSCVDKLNSLQILLIGQILESGRVSLHLVHRRGSLPSFGFLLVLPDEDVSEDDEQCEFDAIRNKQRANAQIVFRSLISLVEKGL